MAESPGSKVPLSGIVLMPIFFDTALISNIARTCRNYKGPPCLGLRLSVSWSMTRHFPLQFLQRPGLWSFASHLQAPPNQGYLNLYANHTVILWNRPKAADHIELRLWESLLIFSRPESKRPAQQLGLSVLGPFTAFPRPVHSHAQTTSIQSPCVFPPNYIASHHFLLNPTAPRLLTRTTMEKTSANDMQITKDLPQKNNYFFALD